MMRYRRSISLINRPEHSSSQAWEKYRHTIRHKQCATCITCRHLSSLSFDLAERNKMRRNKRCYMRILLLNVCYCVLGFFCESTQKTQCVIIVTGFCCFSRIRETGLLMHEIHHREAKAPIRSSHCRLKTHTNTSTRQGIHWDTHIHIFILHRVCADFSSIL